MKCSVFTLLNNIKIDVQITRVKLYICCGCHSSIISQFFLIDIQFVLILRCLFSKFMVQKFTFKCCFYCFLFFQSIFLLLMFRLNESFVKRLRLCIHHSFQVILSYVVFSSNYTLTCCAFSCLCLSMFYFFYCCFSPKLPDIKYRLWYE